MLFTGDMVNPFSVCEGANWAWDKALHNICPFLRAFYGFLLYGGGVWNDPGILQQRFVGR